MEKILDAASRLMTTWQDLNQALYYSLIVVFAALSFTIGGIFMKLSDGLTKPWPSIALFVLFIVGATLQTLAMKRDDLTVTYLIVLGLESVLAFLFGVFVFGESSSHGRIAGVMLVAAGIATLRMSA